MVPVDYTVQTVRPARTTQCDLTAGRASKTRVRIGDRDAILTNGINTNRRLRKSDALSAGKIVADVNAVEEERVLIASRT